jgi:hypothetical protein
MRVYTLKVELATTKSKNVCLIADHNTGKSHTVPLFLAIQVFFERQRPFVFLSDHDPVSL